MFFQRFLTGKNKKNVIYKPEIISFMFFRFFMSGEHCEEFKKKKDFGPWV